MDYNVSDSASLLKALKAVHSGDSILLGAGNYSLLSLTNVNFSGAGVTIASADPTHEAVFAGISLNYSSGLNFSNITATPDPKTSFAVSLGGSSNIKLDGMTLHGASIGDGNAVMVRNSDNVTVTNSDIHDFGTGINHLNSTNLVFSGNNIHAMEADGIRGGGSSNVTISGNTFTDFHPSATDHPDAIQFWTTATTTTTHDITITDNVVTRGTGAQIQGIFVGNEAGIAYKNVTITGNAIEGGLYHGIAVDTADHVTVSDNFVQGYTDNTSWILLKNTTNSVMQDNEASAYQLNTGAGNVGLVNVNNTTVSLAKVGDLSGLKAWQVEQAGVAAGTVTRAVAATTTVATTAVVTTTVAATTTATTAATTTISGTTGADNLVGTGGADTLDGKAGADTMSGGAGNDVYMVDNAKDVVIEAVGGGIDTVKTTLSSYALGDNVENLTLTNSSATQAGYGNSLGNLMVSNGFKSSLSGGDGNDTLVSSGADGLTGGAGNDVFKFTGHPGSPTQVQDFTKGQDKIDLHDILTNYHGLNPVADQWVKMTVDGSGTTIYVDSDGPGTGGGYVSVAKLVHFTGSLTQGSDWIF